MGPNTQTAAAPGLATLGHPMAVVTSFGFRYLDGPTPPAEITVDVRCYFRVGHQELTGEDTPVWVAVLAEPGALQLVAGVVNAAAALLALGNRTSWCPLRIALGCTDGRRRSVVLANAIADRLTVSGYDAVAYHLHLHRTGRP